MSTDVYTGVRVLDVTSEIVNEVYANKKVLIEKLDKRVKYNENLFLIIKTGASQSAVCRVKGEYAYLIRDDLSAQGIFPKNKEQQMAIDVLLDENIEVVALTGRAGSGKTLMALACAIEKVQEGRYDRILLSRPMSNVGNHSIGILPGTVDEKINPYMGNFLDNLCFLVGKDSVDDLISQSKIQFIPLQLIRGASWMGAYVIFDECQTLDSHSILTIGTRLGENSKLVIMGDLAQRDEKIDKKSTGLSRYINHDLAKKSDFSAFIKLIKSERGRVSAHFSDVFEI